MKANNDNAKSSEILDLVVLGALGAAFGFLFIYYFKIRQYEALTVVVTMPVAFLAITRGLKFGAMGSIFGAAIYGSLVLFKIVQGTAQAGFIRESIVNIGIIVVIGFVLGTISETMNFRRAGVFREVTTVETFVPDEETGLYNFKSFRWMLSGEMKRVKRYNTPLSLVFVRINNLGEFQKRYDYEQEVALFRDIGRFLRSMLRDADYVGKYADSELGVILPETNANGVNIVVTRFLERRQTLLAQVGKTWDEVVPELSLSSANFPKDATNLEELIDVIDSRYQPL
ncbi:MAG: diguanylate cyclase [Deltaproteobacteria bacterium]|nr:diguanylate cyclase [Deltaproteobacteria bacterium]